MKRQSLTAMAAACFTTDQLDTTLNNDDDLFEDHSGSRTYSNNENSSNANTNSTRGTCGISNNNNAPLQFHLKLNDIKHVEFVADQLSKQKSPKKVKQGRRYASKSSSSPLPPTASTAAAAGTIHPHSFIVTISTAVQHVELTFYNRQSKDLLIAFLRSTLPKSLFRLKVLSSRIYKNDGNTNAGAIHCQASSNSQKRSGSIGIGLNGTDSGSYYDMDNFEGMALKERFRNESFLEKMQRRCARLVIRAEEGKFE